MTRADLESLGRRAVACAGWRWMPGMLTHSTHPGGSPRCPAGTAIRVESRADLSDCVTEGKFGPLTPDVSHRHPDFGTISDQRERDEAAAWGRALPDLSDPATLGCLLALVREKWAIPTLAPVCKEGVWMFWAGGLPDALYALRAATEVELLVAALEVQNG